MESMGVTNEMMDHSGVSASLPFSSQEAGGQAASALGMSQLAQQAGAESQVTSAHLTLPPSVFSTTMVEAPRPPVSAAVASSLGNLTTYNEVVAKLNRLFDDQLYDVEHLTDEHWKSQEFPLARIKKIMRMDEEVKMISAEVPIMFSKAIEIFITELSLRAWLHTEDAKRRTVQRSDIAMAITKHDMFDFLIDIVPREEIQVKPKTPHKPGESESMQVLSPDILQLYIQQLQQQASGGGGGGGSMGEAAEGEDSHMQTTATLLQQQLQLLQQLIQLQQLQQHAQELEQQQSAGHTMHLQHPPQVQPGMHMEQPSTTTTMVLQQPQVLQSTEQLVSLPGGQQTLRHAPPEVEQQMFSAQSQSATVVIQQPLMDAQSQQPSALLDTHGQYQLQHPAPQQEMQMQSVVQQVLVQNPVQSEPYTRQQTVGGQHFSGGPAPGQDVEEGEGVEFRHIPESESISRSISPIAAALQRASEVNLNTSLELQTSDRLQLRGNPTTGTGVNSEHALVTLQTTMPST